MSEFDAGRLNTWLLVGGMVSFCVATALLLYAMDVPTCCSGPSATIAGRWPLITMAAGIAPDSPQGLITPNPSILEARWTVQRTTRRSILLLLPGGLTASNDPQFHAIDHVPFLSCT